MKTFLFTSLLLVSTILFSQDNKGYYGTKCYVSLESVLSVPVFYNLIKQESFKSNLFNYGYRVSAAYVIKRNLALGLELGYDYSRIFNVTSDDVLISDVNGLPKIINPYYDSLGISTFTFIPKIEFTTLNGLLPLGLTHQIGLGIGNSSIRQGEYNMSYYYESQVIVQKTDSWGYTYEDIKTTYVDVNKKQEIPAAFLPDPIKTYTLLYALNVRTALTKKLLLSYGFRYTMNGSREKKFGILSEVVDTYSLKNDVIDQRRTNIISFNLGLTYAL